MDKITAIDNELKRLHDDYDGTVNPYSRDGILKTINKIVDRLLEEENGQGKTSEKK